MTLMYGLLRVMKNTTELLKSRNYRFALCRTWDNSKLGVLFIGLNPSSVDEINDDPTLARCINFTKSWGYGSVCMANLFAYCVTEPSDMKAVNNPIGNYTWLKKLSDDPSIVVAAWGNDSSFKGRLTEVIELLENLHY